MYLFIMPVLNPATEGSTRMKDKEREKREGQVGIEKKKKGSRKQRAKPLSPAPAIDAVIGDEEQNGKQKKE